MVVDLVSADDCVADVEGNLCAWVITEGRKIQNVFLSSHPLLCRCEESADCGDGCSGELSPPALCPC